jgi:hypothetical protein
MFRSANTEQRPKLRIFFFLLLLSVFILLCGEPYGREYMSSENLSMKSVRT